MLIYKDALIEQLNSTGSVIHTLRVLHVDLPSDDIVVIRLFDKKSLPEWMFCNKLDTELAEGKARLAETDPFTNFCIPEECIPKKHRDFRDRNYALIEPVIALGVKAFDKKERGSVITAIHEDTKQPKHWIYQILRRYWWGGQRKNALYPFWEKCGGKGQERLADSKSASKDFKPKNNAEEEKGRNEISNYAGRCSKSTKLKGAARRKSISKLIRRTILIAAKKYHEKEGLTLVTAHQRMLEEYFSKKVKDKDEVEIPILFADHESPSLRQFTYHYYKDRKNRLEDSLIKSEGKRGYNANYRELLSNSLRLAPYPGALWQIDSTLLDLYIVSSLDRCRIIGRPYLYVVVDVFSRLIVGFCLTLDPPSWLSAALAIENATTDKVAFCAEHGISITLDEWNCYHICDNLQTDRGTEYLCDNSFHIKDSLNINLLHTPPYTPEWKAVVERIFRMVNDVVISWLPGAVHKRERGDPDYRLDSVLTIDEVRKILIRLFLFYNNFHWLKDYEMSKAMIQDHVQPIPSELWKWGIRECGRPRVEDPERIQLNLLHTGEATVTRDGISFLCHLKDISFNNRLLYNCDLALRERWYLRAADSGTWRVPVAYHPRRIDRIYLRLDGGRNLEVCNLNVNKSSAFVGCDWHEVVDYFTENSIARQSHKPTEQQGQAVLDAHVKHIIKIGTKQTRDALNGPTKHPSADGIRSNAKVDRAYDGIVQARIPGEKNHSNQSLQISTESNLSEEHINNDSEYIPPPLELDLINSILGDTKNKY